MDRETIGRDPATGTQPQQMEKTGAQLVRTASRRLHGELSEQGNVKWPACRCLQTHLRQSTLSFDLRHVPQKELCTNLNSLLRLKPTTHHPSLTPPYPIQLYKPVHDTFSRIFSLCGILYFFRAFGDAFSFQARKLLLSKRHRLR